MSLTELYRLEHPIHRYFNNQIVTWSRLSEYFRWLHSKYQGFEKISAGSLSLTFNAQGQCTVELGGYSMPAMSRHEYINGSTELEVWSATLDCIEANRLIIARDGGSCDSCG